MRGEPGPVVVGGGIAGCEAAYALARAGRRTLLVTTSLDTLYALAHAKARLRPPPGSLMEACVGPEEREVGAVALRREAKRLLEAEPRLHLLQSTVSGLMVEAGVVAGVSTWEGIDRPGAAVALCVGSFLRARLTVGAVTETAGRLSEMAYDDLYDDLLGHGFAFEPASLSVEGLSGALPYTVEFQVLAVGERSATGHRLARLGGLYAAGACVGRFDYEASAQDGMELARAMLAGA